MFRRICHAAGAVFIALMLIPSGVKAQKSVISTVSFQGGGAFGAGRLAEWCTVKPGMPWQIGMIMKANEALTVQMRGAGYLLARIDSVAVHWSGDSLHRDLTWYISEDLPFEIGSIAIKSDSLSPENISGVMELRRGDRYDRLRIESDLEAIGRYCAGRGFPFAEIDIDEPAFRLQDDRYETDLSIRIKCGERVRLDFIRIRGNKVTNDNVVLRELDIQAGDIYRQDLIERIPVQLNRLGYFKDIRPPQLLITRRGRQGLLLTLEEGNTTTFDGVIGYVPASKTVQAQAGYFTGLIDLNFRNLFGTGRKFQVEWKKPDQYSDEFRLYYEEPWIFGFPLNIGAGLHRLVRDTTYIERSYLINGLLRLSGNFKISFAVNHYSYVPDSLASREQRLASNRIISGEAGIIYDTRDFPLNPRYGLYYDTYYSFGFKENLGPEYLFYEDDLARHENIQKLRITMAYILPLWKRQVFYLRLTGAQVKSSEGGLQLTDHYWFGGARTVRGYREDQFHGTTIAYMNLEYRFLTGRDSRIFVFNDWGFYNYSQNNATFQDIVSGVGIGVRFDTPLGVMGVDFGMGRGDSFSTGKVHVSLLNNF
jgi:outer membrane protein assembly factor BamA